MSGTVEQINKETKKNLVSADLIDYIFINDYDNVKAYMGYFRVYNQPEGLNFVLNGESPLAVACDSNKTLDIIFTNNVEATYNENKLYSQKAEYSNLKNYVVISKDVRIESEKGNLFAEKLLFDIKKNTLNISSLIDGQINAYIDVK